MAYKFDLGGGSGAGSCSDGKSASSPTGNVFGKKTGAASTSGECVGWFHNWETVPAGGWTGPVKLIEVCRRCGARRDPITHQPIVPYTTRLAGDTRGEG